MRTLSASILLLHGGLLTLLTAMMAISSPLFLDSLDAGNSPGPAAQTALAVAALTLLFAIADAMLLAGTMLLDRSLPHLVSSKDPSGLPDNLVVIRMALRSLRKAAFLPIPMFLLQGLSEAPKGHEGSFSPGSALILVILFSASQTALHLLRVSPKSCDASTPAPDL